MLKTTVILGVLLRAPATASAEPAIAGSVRHRVGGLAAFLLLTCGFADLPVHAADHKQVLVLHSTRRDAQISVVSETELPRTLSAGLDGQVDYYSEFFDLSTFPEYQEPFGEFLRVKYQKVRFDLVIALQTRAIEFVASHRDIFGNSPVVFLSNATRSRLPSSTGVIHTRNFAGTLGLIRQLQPDVNQIFVVSGASTVDRQLEREVHQQFDAAHSPFSFTYLSGLASKALEERLAQLPRYAAVFYAAVDEDGDGKRFHPLEYLERVSAAANVPTYSWVDSAMDHGILGGSLYSQKRAIERVGQLALRVLTGEPADGIPVSTLDLNRNQLDWRQVRRWRISEARIPTGTLISFRDPTAWDMYWHYVMGAVALLVVQAALIGGLLVQRRRRHFAEQKLRGSQRELRKSFDRNRALGTRLLMAQDGERARIARELHDDICQRMLVLTIELEAAGKAGVAQEAVTLARDISKSLHELSHRLHPTRLGLVGMVGALEHLVTELSRGGVPIAFTHEHVPASLPSDVMLCLFRVAQEALHNAVKYSQAGHVSVRVLGEGETLTLLISDDGAGFDVERAWIRGLGLLSMAERLESIRGSLDVWSRPGLGTRITAVVSVDGAEHPGAPLLNPPRVAVV